MPRKDPRIDAYIARSKPFARPILARLRAVVRETCPDVVETLKWGSPSFEYHGILCGMAAFKEHAVFGFWKGKLVVDEKDRVPKDGMGQFGRLTKLSDLPAKRVLAGYVKKAMALNESGVTVKRNAAPKKPIPVPADLRVALAKSAKANAVFQEFSPSARRDYLEWVTEAKRPATRAKRIATTIEWLKAGKRRNWKYEQS